MRKRRIRKTPFVVILLFICLVFGILYFFKGSFQKVSNYKPEEVGKDVKEENYQASFTLAGNVLLNKEMWYDAQTEEGKYDFSNMFQYLNDIMKKSDVNLYSQASPIGGSSLGMTNFYNNAYLFNAPNELIDELSKVGFNTISLAGYHAYDKGISGITNSINYLNSKKIIYSGININEEDRLKNNIFEKDGIKYALLSYTLKTDSVVNENYAVNIYGEEQVKNDISAVKKNSDVIVVTIDWTNPNSLTITDEQRTIVNYLISQGANIIVGNNGNTIEPIEIINNTLVCYSLGNLISGHASTDSRISAVVDFELKITKSLEKTKVEFDDIDVLLTYSYHENTYNYKILPFSKINTELVDYVTFYNKYNELLTKDNDYIKLYSIGEKNGDIKSQS